jgi:hypothetical protein
VLDVILMIMKSVRRIAVVVIGTGTALALLAACGSSHSTKSSSSAAVVVAGSASAATPVENSSSSAGSAGTAGAINVCSLVPIAAVSAASGIDVDSATPEPGAAGISGCSYDSKTGTSVADLESQLNVQIDTGPAMTFKSLKAGFDAAASTDAPTVSISGLGDAAYGGAAGTIVQAGAHLIDVSGLSFDLTGNHTASSGVAKIFIAALA